MWCDCGTSMIDASSATKSIAGFEGVAVVMAGVNATGAIERVRSLGV